MRWVFIAASCFVAVACTSNTERTTHARRLASDCVSGSRCWAVSAEGVAAARANGFREASGCKKPSDFRLIEEHYVSDGSGRVYLTCAPNGYDSYVFGVDILPELFGLTRSYAVAYAKCGSDDCRGAMARLWA
jgi:hypothetical protein